MTGRSWPLALLLSSLVGLSVSQAPSCDSIGFSATVRIDVGTNTYPSEISGPIGNPLVLRCEVTFGSSSPPTIGSYTWERNGQIISTDTRSTLTISNLRSRDGGMYRCRATATTNRCQTEYSTALTVNTRPTLVSISPSTINILEGESFQITCQAEGYPAPTYEWYRTLNTSVILSTQATYSVQAATVAVSGTYVCRASNGQPQPQQGIAGVTVSPPPTTTDAQPTAEPVTTTLATTEEATAAVGNITKETSPTGSTQLYIGIGVISAVSVICTLLTFFCFITWVCYLYKKGKLASNYEGEEMQMEYQEEAFYQDSEEAVLETSVPIETVDTNEAVIPQPKTKKTRGKHRKF